MLCDTEEYMSPSTETLSRLIQSFWSSFCWFELWMKSAKSFAGSRLYTYKKWGKRGKTLSCLFLNDTHWKEKSQYDRSLWPLAFNPNTLEFPFVQIYLHLIQFFICLFGFLFSSPHISLGNFLLNLFLIFFFVICYVSYP